MHRDSTKLTRTRIWRGESATSQRSDILAKRARGFINFIGATGRSRLRELFRCCDDGREILEKRDCFFDGELLKKKKKKFDRLFKDE